MSRRGTDDTTHDRRRGKAGTGSGTLVLGAEQFPECLNPITSCANSSWMHWAVDEHVLPRLMELAPDGEYVPSPLLDGDPVLAGEGVDDSGDPFTVTYTLNADANWSTGGPITCTDIAFTWQATLDTAGTLTTVGFEDITSVEAARRRRQGVPGHLRPALRRLGRPLGSSSELRLRPPLAGRCVLRHRRPRCRPVDIANELNTEIPYSGGPFVLESFDAAGGEATFVRNDAMWDEDRMPSSTASPWSPRPIRRPS